MNFIPTEIRDLYVVEPKVFSDERGYFFESFQEKDFLNMSINLRFTQDNQSLSSKGVLRGLHMQKPPYEQGKLVRVVKGSVLDVAVDIREGSPTYGKYFSIELSEENFKMLWIPPGFAHGFLTLRDNTIFTYKCTGVYNKDSELSLKWDDPDIGIEWGIIEEPIVSEKDKKASNLKYFKSPFKY